MNSVQPIANNPMRAVETAQGKLGERTLYHEIGKWERLYSTINMIFMTLITAGLIWISESYRQQFIDEVWNGNRKIKVVSVEFEPAPIQPTVPQVPQINVIKTLNPPKTEPKETTDSKVNPEQLRVKKRLPKTSKKVEQTAAPKNTDKDESTQSKELEILRNKTKNLKQEKINDLLIKISKEKISFLIDVLTIEQFKEIDFQFVKDNGISVKLFFTDHYPISIPRFKAISKTQLNCIVLDLGPNRFSMLPSEKYGLIDWDKISCNNLEKLLGDLYKTEPYRLTRLLKKISPEQRKIIYQTLQGASQSEYSDSTSSIIAIIKKNHADSIK